MLNIHIKNFFKKLKEKRIIGKLLRDIPFLILLFLFFIVGLFLYYTWDLPQPEKFTETPFIQSTKIYDRTGKVLLYDIYGEEKRVIVPFDQISTNLKNQRIK